MLLRVENYWVGFSKLGMIFFEESEVELVSEFVGFVALVFFVG